MFGNKYILPFQVSRRVISSGGWLWIIWALILYILPMGSVWAVEKRPLSLQDIMKFKEIRTPLLAERGDWVVYASQPDRGNGEVQVVHLESDRTYTIPRGSAPQITKNSQWVAAEVLPDFAALEKAEGAKNGQESKPKNGMTLLNTTTGNLISLDNIKTFAFSDDSNWVYYLVYNEEKKAETKEGEGKKEGKKTETFTLVLRCLGDNREVRVPGAVRAMFDPSSRFLVYTCFDGEKAENNGIFIYDLAKNTGYKLHGLLESRYSTMTWSKTSSRLAFITHLEKKEPAHPQTFCASLLLWDGLTGKMSEPTLKQPLPKDWMVPVENELKWSEDGERLFFGLKPVAEYVWSQPEVETPAGKQDAEAEATDIYHIPNLLKKKGVDVWHWQDPLINPQQKIEWEKYCKRVYTAVYFFKEGRYVQLADLTVPEVSAVDNPDYALGFSTLPYQRELTWDGFYKDVYYINIRTGARKKFITRQGIDGYMTPNVSLSSSGAFAVYYQDRHWFMLELRTGLVRNLTATLPVPFFNEDHDTPDAVPGYGFAGWTEKDASVLIYDKYDIWEFFTGSKAPVCLTGQEGRKGRLVFRVLKTDPEARFFPVGRPLLLSAYSDTHKYTAFYGAQQGRSGVVSLLFMPDRSFSFIMKAKKSDRLLFTRENFQEFPDLWVAGSDFSAPRQVTRVNPQQQDFLWGSASLIEWLSLDGKPLQGIVIKPENYDPTKRYPVLVYYYETFTEELHRYNQVVINHRPCFPYYSGNGYVLFLPDLRYEIGRPGLSALKCLVPGVQKLIDLGIADAGRIGLHGHSWSGYQTAYIITQTNIFAAAIAGAAVSNMTSAYNGIRWGTGLARQFQYEKSQSRIGPSLFEAPERYLENSPIFYAGYIQTPLLLQFGDQDDAVPWYQGIELYLTMRRLQKNCIFLQYNDEPHHLKKYPNKLDYTIKMKEYLDHYLKGEPAPSWITAGVPFRKK